MDYKAVGGDGSSPPPAPDDPWTIWSYTLPSAGDWTLSYSITSGLNPTGDEGTITQSHALFDVVPEAQPATLLALGLGVFLLVGYVRRRYVIN